VKRLISRCLEKDPAARYPTGRELAEALKIVASASIESSRPANSIAVLPFVNASRDPDGEYLSDGIAESIINSLSRVGQIKVMPRSTVFRYNGQDADPQSIGRELHVRVVLTGRVIQRGDTLVVSTELIDVAEGMQLWGERYNRKVSDIFELEEEIARKISESLRVTLTGEDQKRLAKRHTENSEAYQLYLKGRHHWVRRTPSHVQKGAEYFQQAIDKDPGYALAYSGLADCYSILSTYVIIPPKEGWARAKAAAAAAVALDPDLAEAHTSLGGIRMFAAGDGLGAEQEFRRAIELNPGYAIAHYWYALLLVAVGRMEEAEQESRLSVETEPLSPIIAFGRVLTSVYRRRYEEAIDRAVKGLEIDPSHPTLRMWLGVAYQQQGRHAEALAEFQAVVRLMPETAMGIGGLAHHLALTGDHEGARRLLQQALDYANRGLPEAFSLAVIYTGLGVIDQAFNWLNAGCEAHASLQYIVLRGDPRFDPLRSDPRFAEVLSRMGLSS
jgi:TolB-like protein/tetratricopeptide (TPR) repeat protein